MTEDSVEEARRRSNSVCGVVFGLDWIGQLEVAAMAVLVAVACCCNTSVRGVVFVLNLAAAVMTVLEVGNSVA